MSDDSVKLIAMSFRFDLPIKLYPDSPHPIKVTFAMVHEMQFKSSRSPMLGNKFLNIIFVTVILNVIGIKDSNVCANQNH